MEDLSPIPPKTASVLVNPVGDWGQLLKPGPFRRFPFLAALRLRRELPGLVPGIALGALVAALGLGGWLIKGWEQSVRPIGIVLSEEVTLRSGRDLQSRDLLVLHEGAELRVHERTDDWVQVGINEGPRGWLPAGSVGVVELFSADRRTP